MEYIAVANMPRRYGNSRAIWDRTVLPATRHSRLYPSSQLRLVLDLDIKAFECIDHELSSTLALF